MITKTDYYPSRAMAEMWHEKRQPARSGKLSVLIGIQENRIHIGKPPVCPGQRVVTVDGGLRYAIYTEGK